MKKLLLASAIAPLLMISTPASAGTVTVNVPVSVKSMREEIAYLQVRCALGYVRDNRGVSRPVFTDLIPLDNFGNLKQTVSLKINTNGIPPEILHGPERYIHCKAMFFDSSKQTIVLSSDTPEDNAARAALVNQQASNFYVAAEQWVPDAPSPMLQILSGESNNDSTPTLNRPNNLRIR